MHRDDQLLHLMLLGELLVLWWPGTVCSFSGAIRATPPCLATCYSDQQALAPACAGGATTCP
jgi:hypothetical protein